MGWNNCNNHVRWLERARGARVPMGSPDRHRCCSRTLTALRAHPPLLQVPIDVVLAPEGPRLVVRRHGGRQGELLSTLRVDEEGDVPVRVGTGVQGLRLVPPLPGESAGDGRAVPDAAQPPWPRGQCEVTGCRGGTCPLFEWPWWGGFPRRRQYGVGPGNWAACAL